MKRFLFTAFSLLLLFAPCASRQQESESTTSPTLMIPLGFLVVPIHDKQGEVPIRCVGSAADFSDFGGVEKKCDTIITKPSPDETMPRHADIYNLVFVAAGVSAANGQLKERLRKSQESDRRMVITCRYHGDLEACGWFPPWKEGDQSSKVAFVAEINGESLWWIALGTGRRTKFTIVKQLPPYKPKKGLAARWQMLRKPCRWRQAVLSRYDRMPNGCLD
jgi:hypothetical protein